MFNKFIIPIHPNNSCVSAFNSDAKGHKFKPLKEDVLRTMCLPVLVPLPPLQPPAAATSIYSDSSNSVGAIDISTTPYADVRVITTTATTAPAAASRISATSAANGPPHLPASNNIYV